MLGCAAPDDGVGESRADLAAGRTVGVVCDEAPAHADHADAIPDCDVTLDGAPLGRGGVLAAQRFGRDGVALLTRDHRLVLRDARGAERPIADAVADPRVEGTRIAFTELPAGTTDYKPGLPTRLVMIDLARGTRRVVADDALASQPFAVPGSEDVIYVSGRTGVASIWLSSPGQAPRQLTNVGARRVGPGFVAVPSRELTWTAPRRAEYPAMGSRWSLDVDTGVVTEVTP